MTTLPDVLPGHWETDEGSGMAKAYLEKTRAQLCGGHYSDMSVAFQIAMTGRNDLDHEAKLTMAKDRIRWLSAQLAIAMQMIDTAHGLLGAEPAPEIEGSREWFADVETLQGRVSVS